MMGLRCPWIATTVLLFYLRPPLFSSFLDPHNHHHASAARTPPIHSTSSPSPSSSPSESSSSSVSSSSSAGMGAMSQDLASDLSDRSSSQVTPQEGSSSNCSPSDFSLYEEFPKSDQINAARKLSLGWPLSVADNQSSCGSSICHQSGYSGL